jgi:hypothetical protein
MIRSSTLTRSVYSRIADHAAAPAFHEREVTIAAAGGDYQGALRQRDDEVRVVLPEPEVMRVRVDPAAASARSDSAPTCKRSGRLSGSPRPFRLKRQRAIAAPDNIEETIMNKQNELALTDEQLEAISGGCYHKPRHCDDYKTDYSKPNYNDRCDRDRDYGKHDHCGHRRSYCD